MMSMIKYVIFFVFVCLSNSFAENQSWNSAVFTFFVDNDEPPQKYYYIDDLASIDYLDKQKPGLYISVHDYFEEVSAFVYLRDGDSLARLFFVPNYSRDFIGAFFAKCLKKHIEANKDFFLKTCLKEAPVVIARASEEIIKFLDADYPVLYFPKCAGTNYKVVIFQKMDDGKTRMSSFNNPYCGDPNFIDEPLLKPFRKIDAIIKIILGNEGNSCNWRKLVKDPELFRNWHLEKNGHGYECSESCEERSYKDLWGQTRYELLNCSKKCGCPEI